MLVRRVQLNAFGMAFGLVGLSGAWRTAAEGALVSPWVGESLLAASALTWMLTLVAYCRYFVAVPGALRRDLSDDVASPFASLVFITPTLLAAQGLTPHSLNAARPVVDVFALLSLAFGGWLTGEWIRRPGMQLKTLHPGYFLPTVAAGLVAALAAATVGQTTFAQILLGIGMINWLFLGPIILARLLYAPALPSSLLPTLAIQVAPPAAASLAYFAIHGPHIDMLAASLAGYGVLVVLAQVPLLRAFVGLPFGPSFWSFTFSWAAVASTAIVWLQLERPAGYRGLSFIALGAVTLLIALIAVRTMVELVHGRYFPTVTRRRDTTPVA